MTLIRPYSASFYVGDNVTKTFSFVFDEVAEEFVKVMVSHADGTVSIPTYTVDMDLKQVVFGDDTPAPSDDDIVCVYRATPVIQDTPFRTLQGYNAQALENILSKIVAMIQEVKATYFSTQILQGAAWQLDLLKSEDDGATVNIDYVAKKLVKGLYFRINNGNLQVSADGSSYITMPKSSDIVEFRQVQTVLPDLTVQYRLQYRIGNEWFNAESNAEATADEALRIAEEARDIADDAKDIAQDAKDIVDTVDGRVTQAEQDSSDAKNTVDAHVLDTNNPHSVTASQVGLGNVDNTADIDKPISTATQGALDGLQDEIDALKGLGRFLSVWNCATGLAETNPPESPYTYNTGDYFLVGTVGSTNYRPDGATYTTGVASTTVETDEVKVNDVYIYDGTNWKLQANSQRQYTFSGIAGSPYDNSALGNALDGKVDETSTADQVYGTDNNGDPTTYTVTDFGKVDDVKVNNVSVVTSKVANIDLTSYIENTATGTDSLTILGTAATTTNAINIGKSAVASGNKAVSMGDYASAEGEGSIAIGSDSSTTYRARATHKGNIAIGHDAYAINNTGIIAIGETAHAQGKNAIQLGTGTNNTQNTFQVRSYSLLDTSTGLIPDARISTNIARSSDIPTVNNATLTIQKNSTDVATFTANASSNVTANISVPTVPSDIGAQSAITSSNKLNADLVDDSTSTNKFVTASDKTTWNGKQDALTAGGGISISGTSISNSGVREVTTGTQQGAIQVRTGNVISSVAVYGLGTAAYTASSAYATATQGGKADTAVQPGDLATVATSGLYSDLTGTPTIPTTLAGLTGDVSISSPANGEHLVYDGVAGKWKNTASAATVSWGGITGTLSNQTDLQNALDNIDCGTMS